MILWIPCLKWRVNICKKIWEALFADFKFLFLFIFLGAMINYYKSLMLVILYSHVKKKGIYNSLTFKMYSAIFNQRWLFNQDSFEWNIFFIADAVSLTVFSRAGAHKHSPEFPIPEMQILASAWVFSSVKCKFLSSFFSKIKTKHNHQWTNLARNDKRDRQG